MEAVEDGSKKDERGLNVSDSKVSTHGNRGELDEKEIYE